MCSWCLVKDGLYDENANNKEIASLHEEPFFRETKKERRKCAHCVPVYEKVMCAYPNKYGKLTKEYPDRFGSSGTQKTPCASIARDRMRIVEQFDQTISLRWPIQVIKIGAGLQTFVPVLSSDSLSSPPAVC